jgi:predicted metalloprotease with PDZ domain
VLFGPTFLVLPSQQVLDQTRDIPIEIHAPDSWSMKTTWSPRAEKPSSTDVSARVHGFVARDGATLRDAFLVTGTSLQTYAPESTPQTTVAFSPRFAGDRRGVTELIGTVVAGYRESFGSLGPTRVYVDAAQSSRDEPLGGVGRRGGFVIQLPVGGGDPQEIALLVAHEALHLWNGHHLVPHADAEESTRWFKEGFTHYLAIKSALRWGLIDFKFATTEFAELAANYLRNPLSRGAQGRAIDRMRFPYDQGALLALEVDAALARSSNGKVGVEQWLQQLEEVAKNGTYSRETLTIALRRVATDIGSDAPAVMRRHLDSTGPVDIRALFHRADLHWLPSDRSRTARVIALERTSPLYALLFGPDTAQ